ncbi:MAG: sulfite exporter TauE/SafE family protein [Elusimicrobiota bacterium]
MLALAVFAVAFLYSCVGHAGASGYIAAMTLFGLAPDVVKPTALALNILVATLASWQFRRAGHFSWKLFWPLALASVPCALLGGWLNLPTRAFKIIVGLILLASAARFLLDPPAEPATRSPTLPVSLGTGAGLGLLSGLTGTGGGIFLTPLGIFLKWGGTKTIAAVSAVFILVNSAAGLIGHLLKTRTFPDVAWPLALAALAGGAAGSYLGSARLPHTTIKRLLAAVLTIAGLKLILA